jgi:hypothetical protein
MAAVAEAVGAVAIAGIAAAVVIGEIAATAGKVFALTVAASLLAGVAFDPPESLPCDSFVCWYFPTSSGQSCFVRERTLVYELSA